MENTINLDTCNIQDESFFIGFVEENEYTADMLCNSLGCA